MTTSKRFLTRRRSVSEVQASLKKYVHETAKGLPSLALVRSKQPRTFLHRKSKQKSKSNVIEWPRKKHARSYNNNNESKKRSVRQDERKRHCEARRR